MYGFAKACSRLKEKKKDHYPDFSEGNISRFLEPESVIRTGSKDS